MRLRSCFYGMLVIASIPILVLIDIDWKDIVKESSWFPEFWRPILKVKEDKSNPLLKHWIYRGDCQMWSTDLLKNYSNTLQFENGLPKVLHYISNDEDIPKHYTNFYKKCGKLNNDMVVVLWTDASFYKVFVTLFDNHIIDKWKKIFENIEESVRLTMMKTMILYVFGGVSLSLDTLCQRPVREAIMSDKCFVSVGNTMKANIEFDRNSDLGESVFGCTAGHPFLESLIKNHLDLNVNRFYFTNYFSKFRMNERILRVSKLKQEVTEQMLPETEMNKICKVNPAGWFREEACKLLKNYKPPRNSSAMMVHQPTYGLSNVHISPDDICFAGIKIGIIII